MTAPIRGQRRRGTPSLVLPGDPDGCGWIAMGDGLYQACGVNVAPWRHLTRQHVQAQYVGRPTRWDNNAKVVDDGGLGVRYAVMVDGPGFCEGLYADRAAANTRAAWAYESSSRKWVKDEPIELARHLAPLVTADVLSCWCPLDAPCHGDTLCDLVGRLRSGDLVPGLVATLDVCGGALRIEGYDVYTVSELADEVRDVATYGHWTSDEAIENIASDEGVDVELVLLAARVGGAL